MLDYREPPHGDFVALVERLQREQLARSMQPHALPMLSSAGSFAADRTVGAGTVAPASLQAGQDLPSLTAGRSPAPGPLIGAAVGAGLLAFGLVAEGGVFLVLIGAVLLWHNLRKLRRAGEHSASGERAARRGERSLRGGAADAGRSRSR